MIGYKVLRVAKNHYISAVPSTSTVIYKKRGLTFPLKDCGPLTVFAKEQSAIGFYKLIDNKEVFSFAKIFYPYLFSTVTAFIYKNISFEKETIKILNINKIKELKFIISLQISENGEIIDITSAPNKTIRQQFKSIEDFNLIESKLLESLNNLKISFPKIEPAFIDEKAVCYETTIFLNFKI